jgi:GAF domain-containing protein/anti-sigma regulatory factor (Ser/Thr protein kinase)
MQSNASMDAIRQEPEPALEELKRELAEAREQQNATNEILRVIQCSPHDVQPVFETLIRSAMRLCNAVQGNVQRFDGELMHLAAVHLSDARSAELVQAMYPRRPDRSQAASRAVLSGAVVHIPDVLEDPEYPHDHARAAGFRSLLSVPMLRDGNPIGAITLVGDEPGPFSVNQIELLKTFADQAVIAIENARLFEAEQARTRELKESLEYQTATSDVLSVISRSPTDVQPVFKTIARSASRLCSALNCFVYRFDGKLIHFAASDGLAPEGEKDARSQYPLPSGRASAATRAILNGAVEEIPDVQADPDYEHKAGAKLSNYRSIVAVPMLKDGCPIGAIAVTRPQVGPFPRRQIDLLETFADQAVIAIENTRLFEAEKTRTKEVEAKSAELHESLEYQTATGEVLSVISRSPNDLQPVFDTIARIAQRLCQAEHAFVLQRAEGGYRLVAANDAVPDWVTALKANPLLPDRGSLTGRVALERSTVHADDLRADPEYTLGPALQHGVRSELGVPLVRDGEVIGVIIVGRTEVRPFTKRQIALVETFADQAVIAIENTRLFEAEQASKRELQESLEYQTATSEVLNVISRSPVELQPVLNTIVETASRLCKADHAHVYRLQDGKYHLVAHNQTEDHIVEYLSTNPIGLDQLGSVTARAARARKTVHVPDSMQDPEYGHGPLTFSNDRTVLSVPLLREGIVLGVVTVGRQTLRPFTSKEIELVESFADQAVIAIENTRLFEEVQARNRELRVALDQQTATSELLKVIGRSTFELQPVFENLAENAVRLCSAERAFISRVDGEIMRVVASHNALPEHLSFLEHNPILPGRQTASGRAALERRTIHIHDVSADPEYSWGAREIDPYRTVLAIPMLRADELLGAIVIYRREVRPFTANQIALMETFADQAVIAIENARLLEELQARNRDLMALGEVGRAVSSTLDLKVVLKTIVDRAVVLSGTDAGSIFYYRAEIGNFELGETVGIDVETIARLRKLDIAAKDSGLGEAIALRKPLLISDLTKRESNPLRAAAIEAGLRAALIVPLLSSDGPLGTLVLQRRQPGEFPQATVTLMQSFADQSAIALENARLFEEIAQKSRELEIASQHKSQFVANMSHELRTPLAAILGYAELMQEGFYGNQSGKSMDALTRIRSNGKHLLGLINTVLDIAKIESGQFTLNMAEYAIESIVETVRSATESLAQNKKLTLNTEVAKSLPIGLGDEQRLTQVLLNLVGNAIKFTDAGEVRVTAKAINGHFNVSVVDTGPGIPPTEQTRIFEQFHQVDSSVTKAKGGTGLGLAIAKQIVEMHGGRIWVESTVGKGSTFQMEIPTRAKFRKRAL